MLFLESTCDFRAIFCLFVCLLLFWCCAFLMLPEAFGHFLMFHYAFYYFLLLVNSSWQVLLPQHQNNNKLTNKLLWLWEPQSYSKLGTVKKHCQRITFLIRGCLKALFIPDKTLFYINIMIPRDRRLKFFRVGKVVQNIASILGWLRRGVGSRNMTTHRWTR